VKLKKLILTEFLLFYMERVVKMVKYNLYLENLGIPYTGSGSESSKICMNKRITKKILC
jgi:uncharacterized membrane protein required for colicin V production